MVGKILNAGIIVNHAVSFLMLMEADAVLHNHQRQLITLLQEVQGIAEAYRVNLPAPVIGLDERILLLPAQMADIGLIILSSKGHIVGEGDIINSALLDNLQILRLHPDIGAETLPLLQDVARVMAPAMHIRKHIGPVHLLQSRNLILRSSRGRIGRAESNHAANLEIRIDFVPLNHCHGGSHKLIVGRLVHNLISVLPFLVQKAGIGKGQKRALRVALIIDFVEGHPVLNLVLVTLKAYLGKAHKELNHPAVAPAAVLVGQVQRNLEMGQGYHRLHAIFMHLVKEVIVELQAFLIWLSLIPLWENPRPGNAGTEALEAHASQQGNILFVAMIKINCLMVRIILPLNNAVRNAPLYARRTYGHYISHARPLAAHIPGALQLMGSHRAAPQKTFW